jgi:RNA polymerase sigma factor (sigma-70 family)
MLKRRSRRPERGELDAAALALVARHGAQILATARRYAATAEDAEDAYQRGLEILLTKAPTSHEEDLIPWLKTVVKHEAFSLRRQRERHSPVTDDGRLGERPTSAAFTHEQAARFEQLSQGAEALGELKPNEIRALVLRAEGYSYREIGELTGWSYTKVNRLITEGRRAFLRRVATIQGGAECARLEPLLSRLADGEAGPEDLALLRPHMRTCLACRARLREFRAAPARVAALVPPVALATAGDGGLRNAVESALGSAQGLLGERAHAVAELATGQKLVAVAASAAALAGGGAAMELDPFAGHGSAAAPAAQAQPLVRAEPVKEESAVETSPAPEPEPTPITPEPEPEPAPAAPEPEPAPPPPDPANEFAPGGAAPATTASAPAAEPAPAAAPAPAPTGAGEFAP